MANGDGAPSDDAIRAWGLRTALTSDDTRGLAYAARLGFTEENRLEDYDAGGRRPTIVFCRKAL